MRLASNHGKGNTFGNKRKVIQTKTARDWHSRYNMDWYGEFYLIH